MPAGANWRRGGSGDAAVFGRVPSPDGAAQAPPAWCSRDQLLDLTLGRDTAPFSRAVDNQVSRLRRKIERNRKNPTLFATVWGGGYRFTSEVERGRGSRRRVARATSRRCCSRSPSRRVCRGVVRLGAHRGVAPVRTVTMPPCAPRRWHGCSGARRPGLNGVILAAATAAVVRDTTFVARDFPAHAKAPLNAVFRGPYRLAVDNPGERNDLPPFRLTHREQGAIQRPTSTRISVGRPPQVRF